MFSRIYCKIFGIFLLNCDYCRIWPFWCYIARLSYKVQASIYSLSNIINIKISAEGLTESRGACKQIIIRWPQRWYYKTSEVILLMYFGLLVFCLFKASAREFVEGYTSTAVPVFQGERLRFRFARVWLDNGTSQNGNVTKRYMLKNGMCNKMVRITKRYVTKWYMLQNGKFFILY
jgi:hypothetical protein